MGDKKPREKLPTKVFGSVSLPSVFGAGDDSGEDYSAVRGGTLPPPAPPKTEPKPIMPKRPDAPPRTSRMAERVAHVLEEEGDPQMAEAVRASVAPPPLSAEEKEDAARLSSMILDMETSSSLENALEGPDSDEEARIAEPIVVESSCGLEDAEGDEPTQAIETGEDPKVLSVTVDDDADSGDSNDVARGESVETADKTEVAAVLPKPVEPEAKKMEDSWCADGDSSPDNISTMSLPPPPAAPDELPTVRMRISVQREIKIREQFPDSSAEDKAPFILWIDDYGSLRCPLADGEEIIIGRSPECDLVIDSESVSARHFMVMRKGEDCYILDLGSLNGTYIGGDYRSIVPIDEWSELYHGDRITIGKDVALFFSDSKKLKRAPAPGSAKGGKMTENDMKAPTVEVATVPPAGDNGTTDTDGGEENTSPEIVSEEEVVQEQEVKVVDADDKAARHVAPTVPLEMDLPEAKPESAPEQDNAAPPTPPPIPPRSMTKQEERKISFALKVSAVAALLFFIIICFVLVVKVLGDISSYDAQKTVVAAGIEKNAVADHKPVSAIEASVAQFTAVDVLTRMEPLVNGPLGWTPEDPNGPLADIVMGKRLPSSSGDCFPEISPVPPELDALRCCLVLGNNGDVEEIAKCVGMSTVTQLRLAGKLP